MARHSACLYTKNAPKINALSALSILLLNYANNVCKKLSYTSVLYKIIILDILKIHLAWIPALIDGGPHAQGCHHLRLVRLSGLESNNVLSFTKYLTTTL
jgi:hypothetical protein